MLHIIEAAIQWVLPVVFSGLFAVIIAKQETMAKSLKTNHGSSSPGNALDLQTEDLKTLLGGINEIKGDIRGMRRDIGRLGDQALQSRTAIDQAHGRLADRVQILEQKDKQ